MKRFFTMAALFVLGTGMLMAEDGAALYKAKCAGCHGPAGEGKSGPALKGKAEADVSNVLTNGGKKGPHAKGMASLSADQVKAVAGYVASLK
jgi:mono/diheme cytochrome c family protein